MYLNLGGALCRWAKTEKPSRYEKIRSQKPNAIQVYPLLENCMPPAGNMTNLCRSCPNGAMLNPQDTTIKQRLQDYSNQMRANAAPPRPSLLNPATNLTRGLIALKQGINSWGSAGSILY